MRKHLLLLSVCGAAVVGSGSGVGGGVTAAFLPVSHRGVQVGSFSRRPAAAVCRSTIDNRQDAIENGLNDEEEVDDTIRVRIWRALACGEELSLSQLSQAVGERRLGELRSHLTHVERQAKTLRNKSDEWRIRRGLLPVNANRSSGEKEVAKPIDGQQQVSDTCTIISPFAYKSKVRLKVRKGKKNKVFVRFV